MMANVLLNPLFLIPLMWWVMWVCYCHDRIFDSSLFWFAGLLFAIFSAMIRTLETLRRETPDWCAIVAGIVPILAALLGVGAKIHILWTK